MNWSDIDPEKRDLSTPELWDAWRRDVLTHPPNHTWREGPAVYRFWGATTVTTTVMLERHVNGVFDAIGPLRRPEEQSLESKLEEEAAMFGIGTGGVAVNDVLPALESKLDDALARIGVLEAAEQARVSHDRSLRHARYEAVQELYGGKGD